MLQVLMMGSFGKNLSTPLKKGNLPSLKVINTSLVSEGGSFGGGQVSPLTMYKLLYHFATLPSYIFVRINKSIFKT